MIQIIQLVHSSQSGQFFAWIVIDGVMLKIPVSGPRVFYLNSRSPITEQFLGKRVNKTLPHGRQSYNLYEVLQPLCALMDFFCLIYLYFAHWKGIKLVSQLCRSQLMKINSKKQAKSLQLFLLILMLR